MNTQTGAIVSLLEDFNISAWILDEDQTIVYMNRLMQDLFGDLSGEKASIIYGSEAAGKPGGKSGAPEEVVIADVPFRRTGSFVDLCGDGRYEVEFFEDISEQKLIHSNMAKALLRINAETKIAQTIQNSILPADGTYWDTVAYSSMYMPAGDLSGDFYDLLKLSDDEFLLYIADVSGHGIQASLLTIFMRERVRTNTGAALAGPGVLLSKLVEDFITLGIDSSLYVTMAVCKYSKGRRELSISNAGHNCNPLIIRDNGRSETIPIRGMPVCALAEGVEYDEEVISMNPGDRLVLFTDGIVEEVDSTKGRAFGQEGVRALAEKCHAYSGSYLARAIIEESARYSLISAKDDRSIVVADILS